MSMIGNFLRVSQEELNSYLADCELLENVVYPEDEEDEENLKLLDVDKAWDGILYLLTGESIVTINYEDKTSMNPLLICNQLIDGEQDLGYGPAHYITPEEVKEFSVKLGAETKNSLLAKYNPLEMEEKEVYPSIWEREGEGAFEYLYEHCKELQEFYKEAAKSDDAIIFFIN